MRQLTAAPPSGQTNRMPACKIWGLEPTRGGRIGLAERRLWASCSLGPRQKNCLAAEEACCRSGSFASQNFSPGAWSSVAWFPLREKSPARSPLCQFGPHPSGSAPTLMHLARWGGIGFWAGSLINSGAHGVVVYHTSNPHAEGPGLIKCQRVHAQEEGVARTLDKLAAASDHPPNHPADIASQTAKKRDRIPQVFLDRFWQFGFCAMAPWQKRPNAEPHALQMFRMTQLSQLAVWSNSGMILAQGAGGPRLHSQNSPMPAWSWPVRQCTLSWPRPTPRTWRRHAAPSTACRGGGWRDDFGVFFSTKNAF